MKAEMVIQKARKSRTLAQMHLSHIEKQSTERVSTIAIYMENKNW